MNEGLCLSLHQLAVFQGLYQDPVFAAFLAMLDALAENKSAFLKAAARFTGKLYEQNTDDWSGYLQQAIFGLDTCLARLSTSSHELPERMLNSAITELDTLSQACAITPEELGLNPRAGWYGKWIDLQAGYLNCLMDIEKNGTGIFAKASMFRLKNQAELELAAVKNPDPVTFDQLYGYTFQHEAMIDNTQALLAGLPSSNLLLYGDAGTGKSASIKALENHFAKDGLRLIEVGKDRLDVLPQLLDKLALEPLKFIVYIDDLSFAENDDSFSALKAVLEGSVSARSSNTVIYATSNRRHLVKESISARSGDDMHRRDTLQETLSLSQRFGLCLFFEKPDASQYLDLVHQIGQEYGLDLCGPAMDKEAEAFALAKGGRSARCARQFVETKAAKKGIVECLA